MYDLCTLFTGKARKQASNQTNKWKLSFNNDEKMIVYFSYSIRHVQWEAPVHHVPSHIYATRGRRKSGLFKNALGMRLPPVQFHWQFLTTNSGFWLVNILVRKFNTSSKKEMKMIKSHFLMKNAEKVYVNMK